MEKILFQVKDNILYIKVKKNLNNNQLSLLNTNIISDNELLFTDEYILSNKKIITTFLHELAKEQNIDTVYIYNIKILDTILSILKGLSSISNVVFKDDVTITYNDICELENNNYIKTISFYSLHDFFIEYLDKLGMVIEVRNEIFLTSEFSKNNSLTKFSTLYYKKVISIHKDIKDIDKEEFNNFLGVNKYLKVIHLNTAIYDDVIYILDMLLKYKKKNIKVFIHSDNINEELVHYIKKFNLKNKKDKINVSLTYSDKFLEKNLLPQTNLNIIKMCIILILIFIMIVFSVFFTANYIDYRKDNSLKNEIIEYIDRTDTEDIIKDLEDESNKKVINDHIASLLTLNKDVSSWIKIGDTIIDYPVLSGNDNKYYLNHDIKKDYSRTGSIFMHYKNDVHYKDANTILFGHNTYGSPTMFGTLDNYKKEKFRNNPDNLIINIETLYEDLEFKVFSYYTTNVTISYLQNNFEDDLEKLAFFEDLKKKSEYKFDVEFDLEDRIVTLSTCASHGTKRFVVHGLLID